MPQRERAQREQIATLKGMLAASEKQLAEMRALVAQLDKKTGGAKQKQRNTFDK